MKPRVLVVDDKDNVRHLLARILGERMTVVLAVDGDDAEGRIRSEPFDVVLSDIRMPGKSGLEVLRLVKAVAPETEVVLMTAFASVQSAVEAIREGAFDYLPKPFDPDEALLKVERAAERKALRDRAAGLERDLQQALHLLGRSHFGDLMGRSEPMQRVFALLEKAAARDLTVLLTGESGTGKELAARAIHHNGPRSQQPFVPINCGALPDALMESELFGHRKGAFTGADSDRAGLLEEARGGTVFLDEIGELPLQLQVKLNRALQERELRRVGDTQVRRFEARVVAATNRDLLAAIAQNTFREDLYYRLNVFPIALPTLRERREDIPLLAQHFLARTAPALHGFAPDALRKLLSYDFPGNVRQLENVVARAAAVADGERIEAHDLPLEGETRPRTASSWGELFSTTSGLLPYREAMERVQHEASSLYLEAVLALHQGNVSKAAEAAGMARESLHRLLRRHAIDPARHRD